MSDREQQITDLQRLTELDRVVHEPARLMILAFLSVVRRADFLYLEQQTGMTRGNMASHLRKLEEAGYVAVEKMFVEKIPRTVYHLTDVGRSAFQAYRGEILSVLSSLTPGKDGEI